jgi:hypothetical protein
MPLLLQLDSGLPSSTGGTFDWGIGSAVAYGFWCDRCATSAFYWQGT